MSSFTQWLSGLFGKTAAEIIESGTYNSDKIAALSLKKIAIQTAVGYIASAVGQCDFRTFLEGEESKREEYFLWNYSPNINQNSTQFLEDWVNTLIYNNEALIVERNGSLYIADAFGTQEEGMKETLYTGITVNGVPFGDRLAKDVMYFRLNNDDIQPMLADVCKQYEDIITSATDSYERAGADRGILNIQATQRGKLQDYDQIKKDLLNNRFKDFFSKKNAVLPLYDGFTYTPHTRSMRNTSEINDVKTMSDEIYNHVGQVFRIPPSMLRGEVASSANAEEMFLKYGVHPYCNMLQEEITRKRYGRDAFTKGSYVMVDASNVEIGGIFNAAAKIDKLISCGVYSIDEIRNKIGEPLLGTEEAQAHYITKNYAEMQEGREQKNE